MTAPPNKILYTELVKKRKQNGIKYHNVDNAMEMLQKANSDKDPQTLKHLTVVYTTSNSYWEEF
jgi:predicted transcriptional regulator with HTH domain